MILERKLGVYRCELCGKVYPEADMVIYNNLSRQGKCRECVRELERQRKGMNVVRVENSLANPPCNY